MPEDADIVAHVQRAGDVPGKIGDWVGTRGSRQWIEGFSLAPRDGIKPTDLEYQAVLGRGWLSPWIEGGKFCGSRGMALPLLGLKVRLKGAAAKTHECSYSATFRRRQRGRTGPGRRGLRSREPGRARGVPDRDHRRRRAQAPAEARTAGNRKARAAQPAAAGRPPDKPSPARSSGERRGRRGRRGDPT